MSGHDFHQVTEIGAVSDSKNGYNWFTLFFTEGDRARTNITLHLDDSDLAKRLADAINAAQVVKIDEAA
jgi:phosphoserine aminotransferase